MEEPKVELNNLLFHRGWIIPTLIILALTPLIHYILQRIYKRISPRVEATSLSWDSSFLKALILPLKVLVWTLGISFAIQLMAFHFEKASLVEFFNPFRNFCFVIISLWFALRFIRNMEREYIEERRKRKKRVDQTTTRAIAQISRFVAVIIATLIYLQTRNVNLSAVLAFGGAGGLVVGLAAKDLLANFFGGLMIYLDRPFSVGDWIQSPDQNIEGFVENIGWRLTRIRTFERRPIYVPNGIFSNISVVNASRMSNRRIKTSVGVRYQDASKIEVIVPEIEALIRNHPGIDTDKFLAVGFNEFASSSLNIIIYCFTKTTKWVEFLVVQQEIFLKTIQIIEKHGAQCAFPTSTLHFPDELQLRS